MNPTLTVRPDRTLLRPDTSNRRALLVEIAAPSSLSGASRPPLNLAVALDRSGSMAGDRKLALAVDAVEQTLRRLTPRDRVTVVTFDDRVEVVVPPSMATPHAVEFALRALSEVAPRGQTDLFGGWERAAGELTRAGAPGDLSRVVLLSDGLANQGVTDEPAMVAAATEQLARGVSTSTLGVGADFDERLMTSLAVAGGGNAWFASHATRVPEFVQSELGEALEVVTRSARLVVEAPAGCVVRGLNRFRTLPGGTPSRAVIDLGALASRQVLELAIELHFGPGEAGPVRVSLEADGDVVAHRPLDFTLASHDACSALPREVAVVRAVAAAVASSTRMEALQQNRAGHFEEARTLLRELAARIARWARGDAQLEALAGALEDEACELSGHVSSLELKQQYYRSHMTGTSREANQRSKRR
jgi:Ca-activated chloride channel family protein